MISGVIVFTTFYALCTGLFYLIFGWPAVFWYALSLPVTSLLAHYYVRELRRFTASLRAAGVLLWAPAAGRKLLAWRSELIALIQAEQQHREPAPTALKDS